MQYTIRNVNRRSEWQGRDGQTMVDWAIALDGEEGWVKLTQKLDTKPPEIGQTINGTIEDKRDKNGNEYRKFTKEYRGGGASGGLSDDDRKQIDYIVTMLEELTGRRDPDARDSVDSSNILDDGDPFPGL